MSTKEQLIDPDFIPYSGQLRTVQRDADNPIGYETELQQYDPTKGWLPIPLLEDCEIPKGGATPNARNP